MANARSFIVGCGTQTSALGFGGEVPTFLTEEYDGTSWTAGGTGVPSYRRGPAATGTQTAALCAGGGEPLTATAFIYDGTSWTAVASMSQAREFLSGAGTQTSSLAFGSRLPYGVFTEEFTGGPTVVAKTVTGT